MYITELPYRLDDDFYLKDFVEDIVLQLVSDTSVARVDEVSENNNQCILEITVDSEEVGKIVGRNRAIIQSLWNLVVAITRGQKKVVIRILNQAGEVQYPLSPEGKRNNNGETSQSRRSQH